MRLAISAIAVVLLSQAEIGVAAESVPYKAYVAHDRTLIRSGPGDDHYATERLSRGAEVEVHQRASGGWLGIRPPKESFSWIAQRDVALADERSIAKVVSSSAVSWIGSNVEEVESHRWLVQLEVGEPLSIVGKKRQAIVAEDKSELYYRIAPPAGEFRWIHEDDVVASKDDLTIKDRNVELADFRVALRDRPRPKPETAESTPRETEKKDDFMARRGSAPRKQTVSRQAARVEKQRPGSEPLILDEATAESRVREFEARLSLLVAQGVEKWDFSRLRKDAEEIAANATSTLDRARMQVFLDKIADFEGLRSRHATYAPPAEAAEGKSQDGVENDSSTAGEKELDPRFDGTGWLLPVHSTKRPAPPYALLDSEGNILKFVSPAPGLILNRYLRKEVGIFGQKQQVSTLEKPHLTAHRIVELDRHRR